ncbi:MAG TPA: prolyl oligopeptidase family serine peptidase [Mycobacteriales bacterium]|nr:prolyl oligopeptidase family serine peptidase [Mycobacteriales bacterium]
MSLPPLIRIEDFFAAPAFSKPAISPDGTRLAYLAPAHGHLNVWIRGIEEEHADAVCVTHSRTRGIPNFYWTRDPRWLLYRQDTDGNEDWHYYRVDLDNPDAEPVDLTPMPPGCRAMGGEHPTKPGKFFAAMNPRFLFMDAFEIDIATGETTLLYESSSMLDSYTDVEGNKGFFMTQAADGAREIHAVDDRAAGVMRLVHSEAGPCWPLGQYPVYVNPDNTFVIINSYDGGSDDSRLIRIEHSGEKTVFAEKPGHSVCSLGSFEEDFGRPQSIVLSPRTWEITAVRFVGDRPELVPLEPHFAEVYSEVMKLADGGELGWLNCDESEQVWVVTFIHDRRPGLSYLYDHRTRMSKLLNDPSVHFDPADLAATGSIHLNARDGLPLHGFLTLPVGVEPKGLPMVVKLHGGPWIHDIWMFNAEVQLLANRGYAVLQVNFRGSSGYGRRHMESAIKEWAGAMHTDVIDACDWAVQQGIADPDRIGIYGGSYGGYATLVGITVTPDYFAAAIDYVGVSSIPGFIGDLPDWIKPLQKNSFITHCGDPDDPDDLADMLARSPVTMLEKIKTPLLVIQGAQDARVKQSESDAIVDGLRSRGVDVEYFVAEDEGHDFKNPANLIKKWQLAEKHLAKHLGGRATA